MGEFPTPEFSPSQQWIETFRSVRPGNVSEKCRNHYSFEVMEQKVGVMLTRARLEHEISSAGALNGSLTNHSHPLGMCTDWVKLNFLQYTQRVILLDGIAPRRTKFSE